MEILTTVTAELAGHLPSATDPSSLTGTIDTRDLEDLLAEPYRYSPTNARGNISSVGHTAVQRDGRRIQYSYSFY